MKKILLLAVAALMVGTANAQLQKKQNAGKPQAKQQVALTQKSSFKQYQLAGVKPGIKATAVGKMDKKNKMAKTFKGAVKVKNAKPAFQQFKARRASALLEKYEGMGTLRSTGAAVEWDVYTGTVTMQDETTVNVIQNLIPDIFGFEYGVLAPYSIEGGNVVIPPTLVASFPDEEAPTGTYYLFLESATSSDGSITLTLDDTGAITGTYDIIYSVYPYEEYNYDDWVATYDGIRQAQYNVPGVIKVPTVGFEQGNLVLFAGLGLNGYSYNSNLAMAGAYTNVNFMNRTSDKTTAWQWTAYDASTEDPTVLAEGTDKDFVVATEDYTTMKNVQLVGINQTAESDPFIYGVGKSKDDDESNHYENCYIYSAETESDFMLNDETPAIFTRQDPDGDLTFYTNWATPDKYETSMSSIVMYHEKPAAPLYIEGITLPMVGFSAQDDFNLHIKIQKVSYPEGATKPVFGDIIAEGDATKENINADFNAGLTAVEIPLYMEDEFGMSTELDYLFIDDEFVLIIEGWDNGTFSGILGSQDSPLDNARTCTWFTQTGDEEGYLWSYTQWKTCLFTGFLGATYGFLHTDDDTNMTIPAEGGQASINVHPMFSNGEEAAAELGYQTRLFLDENVEGNEIPDWLSIGFANEDYTDTYTFDLVAEAEALPEGVEGRQAVITFCQEGAQLTIKVSQGDVSGITATKASVKVSNAPAYNLAGQRVGKNYKGLVVKDGVKFLNK